MNIFFKALFQLPFFDRYSADVEKVFLRPMNLEESLRIRVNSQKVLEFKVIPQR